MMSSPEHTTSPTERAQVHVCLISAQATPNLTPVLDPALKPGRVVMLVSPDMSARAKWLEDVLRPLGIVVEKIDVPDPWDISKVSDQLMEWLGAQPGDPPVALNVTGGTKPMAMAAQQVFAMDGKPVFYVHQERDEILWLTPRRPPTPLKGKLKLEPYLHAHGWKVIERPALPALSSSLRELTGELVLQCGSLERALGVMNWYAQQCEGKPDRAVKLEEGDERNPGFMALIDKFARFGACRRQGNRLIFDDERARFFCNGGWLEQHVVDAVNTLRKRAGIQDLAAGLRVRALDNRLTGSAGSNELDVVFIARNRLHIIECKTRSFRDRNGAADAVYKLDALTALGGLNTRGLLVSYRQLSDGDRQRAKDLRIRTVVGGAISRLPDELMRWIENATP